MLALTAACAPASASASSQPERGRAPVVAKGALVQLNGKGGCLVDRSRARRGCTSVRALAGPGPFLGSNAVAISPDGRNVYVASSRSNAIAVFARDARTGRLTQRAGRAGCIAARGARGCARGRALIGPNSVAISPDGRTVHATSVLSDSVLTFRRNRSTGALRQLEGGSGCVAGRTIPGCATGRALDGPDVVAVSPDGRNVYVGAFAGNAVAVFARDTSTGALTQPADATGCVTDAPTAGCTTGLALGAPEGMAISADGANVYVAAATSNSIAVFSRDAAGGALTQAGCIVASPLAGCTTGVQLEGANAVAISPDGEGVYVTSLESNSLTTFDRAPATGQLTQKSGTSACAIYLLAVGCSLARELRAPEGLAVSPDGASVYAAAFRAGAVGVFDRAGSGAVMQKPRRPGCVTTRPTPGCLRGRALLGVSSIAVSPDGRHAYAAAFKSDAIGVFKRIQAAPPRGKERP